MGATVWTSIGELDCSELRAVSVPPTVPSLVQTIEFMLPDVVDCPTSIISYTPNLCVAVPPCSVQCPPSVKLVAFETVVGVNVSNVAAYLDPISNLPVLDEPVCHLINLVYMLLIWRTL